jgi:hypothetical protein
MVLLLPNTLIDFKKYQVKGASSIFMDNVTIISSGKNWMEQTAVEQLHKIATLPGGVKAVG